MLIHSNRWKIDWEKDYLLLIAVATFLYALMVPARTSWLEDYAYLMTHQTYLLHDFIEVAGVSATFVNIAIHFGVAYYLNSRNTLTHLTGFQLAAVGIFVGHGFFGTHLLNITPIILGVVLYSLKLGQSFKIYTSLSLFATSTAPLVSYVMFVNGVTLWSILAGFGVGLVIGFITPPLAEAFLKFHQGYTLYNIGFTCGIIGLFAYACLRSLGFEIPSVQLLSQTSHTYLLAYLLAICLPMMLFSLFMGDWDDLKLRFGKLNHRVGRLPDDFVIKYGRRVVFFNMGLMGLVYIAIVVGLGFQLNGPIAGGILSIVGFASFGKHLKNTLPIAVGVFLAAYFSGQSITHIGFALSLLFGTALAPIAGYYGILIGLFAGFLQYHISQSLIGLHLGLSLYNNGFSSGFVAAFLVPIFESIIPKNTK